MAGAVLAARETSRFLEILGGELATPARQARAPATPAARSPPPAATATGPIRALVEGALHADREIEAVLDAARGGRTFSPAELLEVQITVFRCAQTVEIISRGVDKVVAALKQALNTQI